MTSFAQRIGRKTLAFAATGAAIALTASPAAATQFIGFTDNATSSTQEAGLRDTSFNAMVRWTQTVATTNVTVSALLRATGAQLPSNWWITDTIGNATQSNVIASGVVTPPSLSPVLDFNTAQRTTLATGLSFAAGSYYLVLDGPSVATADTAWVGDLRSNLSINTASGFSVGSYSTSLVTADPFGPNSSFIFTPNQAYVFDVSGDLAQTGGVPEPGTWALMIGGFGLAGAALRRRRHRPLNPVATR